MFLMSSGVLNVKVYIYVAWPLLDYHGNWGSMLEVSGRQRDLDEPCKCRGRDGEREIKWQRKWKQMEKSKKETLKWGNVWLLWEVCTSCFSLLSLVSSHLSVCSPSLKKTFAHSYFFCLHSCCFFSPFLHVSSHFLPLFQKHFSSELMHKSFSHSSKYAHALKLQVATLTVLIAVGLLVDF